MDDWQPWPGLRLRWRCFGEPELAQAIRDADWLKSAADWVGSGDPLDRLVMAPRPTAVPSSTGIPSDVGGSVHEVLVAPGWRMICVDILTDTIPDEREGLQDDCRDSNRLVLIVNSRNQAAELLPFLPGAVAVEPRGVRDGDPDTAGTGTVGHLLDEVVAACRAWGFDPVGRTVRPDRRQLIEDDVTRLRRERFDEAVTAVAHAREVRDAAVGTSGPVGRLDRLGFVPREDYALLVTEPGDPGFDPTLPVAPPPPAALDVPTVHIYTVGVTGDWGRLLGSAATVFRYSTRQPFWALANATFPTRDGVPGTGVLVLSAPLVAFDDELDNPLGARGGEPGSDDENPDALHPDDIQWMQDRLARIVTSGSSLVVVADTEARDSDVAAFLAGASHSPRGVAVAAMEVLDPLDAPVAPVCIPAPGGELSAAVLEGTLLRYDIDIAHGIIPDTLLTLSAAATAQLKQRQEASMAARFQEEVDQFRKLGSILQHGLDLDDAEADDQSDESDDDTGNSDDSDGDGGHERDPALRDRATGRGGAPTTGRGQRTGDTARDARVDLIDEAQLTRALGELDSLVGLAEVKAAIRQIVDVRRVALLRAQAGLEAEAPTLHMAFLGGPGTGKTTVARLIGEIFAALGVLSHGRLTEVTRGDLVARYVGQTAPKTTAVVRKALGGVLFIDEAYALGSHDAKDFGKEAIDTLTPLMENHRDNLCVIFAGYDEGMYEVFAMNPGLDSRVPHRLNFVSYTTDELMAVMARICAKRQLTLDDAAWDAARVVMASMSHANGRTVRNLVDQAVLRQAHRVLRLPEVGPDDLVRLCDVDVVPAPGDPARLADALAALDTLLGAEALVETVGSIAQLGLLQAARRHVKRYAPAPVTHLVIEGEPGTGKTTAARLVARVYWAAGLLASDRTVDVSAAEFAADPTGVVDRARDAVLFIDEAHRLGEYPGAVSALSKAMEDRRDELSVILAGYYGTFDAVSAADPGFASRVAARITMSPMSISDGVALLVRLAGDLGYAVAPGARTDAAVRAALRDGGNGRAVRALLERALAGRATRGVQADDDVLDERDIDAAVRARPDTEGSTGAYL